MDVGPKGDLILLVILLLVSFITHFGVNGFFLAQTKKSLTAINGTYISIFYHLKNGVKVSIH